LSIQTALRIATAETMDQKPINDPEGVRCLCTHRSSRFKIRLRGSKEMA
jgi:hypothetical protein